MSIVLELRRVTPEEAEALARDPSDILWFLTGIVEPPGSFARLLGAEEPPERAWEPPPEDRVTDVDKAWHCIHFLLAGDAEGGPLPAATLMTGGRELGPVHVGYGPPRLLSPDEAGRFAALVDSVTEGELRARYDPAALAAADIYPGIWARDGDDAFDYVWHHFERMQAFMRAARTEGDAVILSFM